MLVLVNSNIKNLKMIPLNRACSCSEWQGDKSLWPSEIGTGEIQFKETYLRNKKYFYKILKTY
jgi:hypothetical protein